MNRNAQQPAGDLARCVTHEADTAWPEMLEIVAYWGHDRRGKSRRIAISADQFFGRRGYGAPMSGEQLIGMIDRLRRQK